MTELITDNYPRFRDPTIAEYNQNDENKIRDLLLGHRVAMVDGRHLELDDGTVMKLVANEGCGGCNSGWYNLTALNGCDNVITAVEFDNETVALDEWGEGEQVYSVFVVAEDKRINLYAVSGDNGNGYYGTGYRMLVRFPEATETT